MKHRSVILLDPKQCNRKVLVVALSLDEDFSVSRRKLETAGRMLKEEPRFKYLFLVVNRRPKIEESGTYNKWYAAGLEILQSHCTDIEKRVIRKYFTASNVSEDLKKDMRRIIEQGRCRINEYGFYLITDKPEKLEEQWHDTIKYPVEVVYASKKINQISYSIK